jgi:hypothetical protein
LRVLNVVTQQKLNLFKFATSQVAQSCEGTAQVMLSEIRDASTFRSRFDDVPDGMRSRSPVLGNDLANPQTFLKTFESTFLDLRCSVFA